MNPRARRTRRAVVKMHARFHEDLRHVKQMDWTDAKGRDCSLQQVGVSRCGKSEGLRLVIDLGQELEKAITLTRGMIQVLHSQLECWLRLGTIGVGKKATRYAKKQK